MECTLTYCRRVWTVINVVLRSFLNSPLICGRATTCAPWKVCTMRDNHTGMLYTCAPWKVCSMRDNHTGMYALEGVYYERQPYRYVVHVCALEGVYYDMQCSSIHFCNSSKRGVSTQINCRRTAIVIPWLYSCLHPRPTPCRHKVCGDWQCN